MATSSQKISESIRSDLQEIGKNIRRLKAFVPKFIYFLSMNCIYYIIVYYLGLKS